MPNTLGIIQYEIETDGWVIMKDEDVILHVRSLQNVILVINNVYASVTISCHHFCCLVVFVGMLYVAIKLPGEIIGGGFAACIFVGFVVILPVAVQYLEADLVGKNVEVFSEFELSFYLCPYGSVGRHTFFQFLYQ